MKKLYAAPELELTALFAKDVLMVSGELASDNEVDIDGDNLYK